MRPPYGKTSLSGLLLLAAIVGGLYTVVIFGPVYADDLNVREVIEQAHNLINNRATDAQVRGIIKQKLRMVGEHEEQDEMGNVRTVMGLNLADEQIIIDRNEPAGTFFVEIDYEREVRLKPTQRVVKLHFNRRKDGILPR